VAAIAVAVLLLLLLHLYAAVSVQQQHSIRSGGSAFSGAAITMEEETHR